MRDPKRIPRILAKLAIVWNRPGYSDQRLGQLIWNLGFPATKGADNYHAEDDVWEARLDTMIEEITR